MTSAQSSQDAWHTLHHEASSPGNAQRRHRSQSTYLGDRLSVKAATLKCQQWCPCTALHVGDAVRVFSRTGNTWVHAVVVQIGSDQHVRVEYAFGKYWCGKTLHIHSEHLEISSASLASLPRSICMHGVTEPGNLCSQGADEGGGEETFKDRDRIEAKFKDNMHTNTVGERRLAKECEADPHAYYMDLDQVWYLLENGHVVLIRGTWLMMQSKMMQKDRLIHKVRDMKAKSGSASYDSTEAEEMCSEAVDEVWKPLPSRQHLPPEAIVDVNLLQKVSELPGESIVGISHCWLDKNHPDPNSSLLDEIAPIIWCYLASCGQKRKEFGFDGAFFFAWCSMHQPYHVRLPDGTYRMLDDQEDSQISLDVAESFRISLENMHIWYAHARIEKWLFMMYFDDQGLTYHERGWPTWERAVAGLLGRISKVLYLSSRLGKVNGFFGYDWGDEMPMIRAKSSSKREPPLSPQDFRTLMEYKHFTREGVDRKLVLQNYEKNFSLAASCITNIEFPAMNWDGPAMTPAFAFLSYCDKLRLLDLGGNGLGDCGADRLARSLHHCHELDHLELDDNSITAPSELWQTLTGCKKMKYVNLRFNHIGDDGACAIADLYMHCSKLGEIDLTMNKIGDDGASSIIDVLRYRSEVRCFDLSRNRIQGKNGCFARLSSCDNLEDLCLSKNLIGDDAARELARSLLNCSRLQSFEFAGNPISDAAIADIVATLARHDRLEWHSVGGEPVFVRVQEPEEFFSLGNGLKLPSPHPAYGKKFCEALDDNALNSFIGPSGRHDDMTYT